MNLQKAQQAIVNGVYAAVAWLILDIGLLFQQHGEAMLSVIAGRPEMAAGAILVIVCIVGLMNKSRLAAIVLFLLFVLPLILRLAQGRFPSTIFLIFSLVLLYFFLTAVLGTFSYHSLKASNPDNNGGE
jgi:hypothetical protein